MFPATSKYFGKSSILCCNWHFVGCLFQALFYIICGCSIEACSMSVKFTRYKYSVYIPTSVRACSLNCLSLIYVGVITAEWLSLSYCWACLAGHFYCMMFTMSLQKRDVDVIFCGTINFSLKKSQKIGNSFMCHATWSQSCIWSWKVIVCRIYLFSFWSGKHRVGQFWEIKPMTEWAYLIMKYPWFLPRKESIVRKWNSMFVSHCMRISLFIVLFPVPTHVV